MNTPRQDDNKAVGPQNAATKENPKVTGSGPSVPSKTIPPPNDTKEPCHCHYEPTPRWMRWLEAIGVIAVIAYAIITYCMWYEIQEQTKISRQQLEATERPWVSADVTIAQPLVFDNRGAVTGINVNLVNTGHSVAKFTSVWSGLVVDGVDSPQVEQDRLCAIPKAPLNAKSDYGYLIFPNQPPIVEFQPTIAIPEKLLKGIQQGITAGWFDRSGRIGLHIVVCVDYLSPFDTKHHQTRNIYILSYPERRGNFDIMMGAFDPHTAYNKLSISPIMHGASAD